MGGAENTSRLPRAQIHSERITGVSSYVQRQSFFTPSDKKRVNCSGPIDSGHRM